MTSTTTHFTAWLTNTSSALDQDNIDIVVLEDEQFGDTKWISKGGPALFTAITSTPAENGDHEKAMAEAEDLLSDAGWNTVGTWDAVETGYVIAVERA